MMEPVEFINFPKILLPAITFFYCEHKTLTREIFVGVVEQVRHLSFRSAGPTKRAAAKSLGSRARPQAR